MIIRTAMDPVIAPTASPLSSRVSQGGADKALSRASSQWSAGNHLDGNVRLFMVYHKYLESVRDLSKHCEHYEDGICKLHTHCLDLSFGKRTWCTVAPLLHTSQAWRFVFLVALRKESGHQLLFGVCLPTLTFCRSRWQLAQGRLFLCSAAWRRALFSLDVNCFLALFVSMGHNEGSSSIGWWRTRNRKRALRDFIALQETTEANRLRRSMTGLDPNWIEVEWSSAPFRTMFNAAEAVGEVRPYKVLFAWCRAYLTNINRHVHIDVECSQRRKIRVNATFRTWMFF